MRSVSKAILAVTLCAGFVACGPPTTNTPYTPKPIVLTEPTTKAAVTAVGTVIDDATTAMIGADGGTLTTLDGMLTITVEPGTVPDGTLFSAQPITNNAPGGFGTAFRLSKPASVTFAKPVTLSFRFLPNDLVGTAPGYLRIGTQRAGGTWKLLTPTIDMAKQTMTVTTTTFSDWGPLSGLQLLPRFAEVRTKKKLQLYLKYCRGKEYPDPENPGETLSGIGIGECNMTANLAITKWSVNGVEGGNPTLGTVVGNGGTAVFTAPENVPSPDTVSVSVEVPQLDTFDKQVVLTNIRVVNFDGYIGNLRVRAKGTSSGETITMTAFAKLKFQKMKSNGDTETRFSLLGDESEVSVAEWRAESSGRTCVKSGAATVFPGGFMGDLATTTNPDTYGVAGTVTLQVPALCTPRSGGSMSMRSYDGLAFVFGTGLTIGSKRPMPDRELLLVDGLGLNATFGGNDGVVVTQDWGLVRSFDE
ncbi:MAG: hypothetical protein GQE15_42900 [Archangiaceae bacterium]|nr:hypothetical protein [Archangiaceae bacterium]